MDLHFLDSDKSKCLTQINAEPYESFKGFNLPCMYLHWQVKLLSNLQTMCEDMVNDLLICYANGFASWK